MAIDPVSAHLPEPAPLREVPVSVTRSARRVSMTASGDQGTQQVTGPVVDAAAATSTSPGFVAVYDVKNKQLVVKSPAPHRLASA
jgi:hypothetical protein